MPTRTLRLDIRNVDDAVIVDPLIHLRLARPSDASGQMWTLALDGKAKTVQLDDAPAGDPLNLRLSLSRYRDSGMFAAVQGSRIVPETSLMTTPRTPSEWLPSFTPWAKLGTPFAMLTQQLEDSARFQLGRQSAAGTLVKGAYDAVSPADQTAAKAKMTLLNLYSRLAVETPPSVNVPWFEQTTTLLLANRERLLSTTTAACVQIVRSLSSPPGGGYKKADPVLHRPFFEDLPGVTAVRGLASIKTEASRANLQLTICEARLDGQDVCLLDTDIDEHGALLAHTFDLIRHVFTGGTDPIDVHESLRELFPKVTLGYGLAPRARIGTVTVRVRGATR